MHDHTIVAGYGTMGRGAVDTLLANGVARDRIVVVDRLPDAVAAAGEAGLTGVVADATRTATWHEVRLDRAGAVVITCNRDDTSTLATLTARELNPQVPISVAVREAENAHLLSQSGATTVVLSSEAAGRLVGLSTLAPAAVGVLEDLMVAGAGLDLVERPIGAGEIGGPPHRHGSELPVALLRAGTRIPFDDDAFDRAEPGDVVVSVAGRQTARP